MVERQPRFGWYELLTTDLAAAQSFYGAVLGWQTRSAATPRFDYRLFTMGERAVCGLMELPPEGRRMGAAPRWVGYVVVDDLESMVARLQRLGGAVYVPPTETNIGRVSIVRDPQGATLALAQELKVAQQPAEPDPSGGVGWHELLATDVKAAFAFYNELFGWERAQPLAGAMDSYQLLSAGGHTIGGMFDKLPIVPFPFWLYYFNVADVGIAARRVTAAGGRITQGPNELPDVGWIVWCIDPQGAMFALQSPANEGGTEKLSTAELGWSTAWGSFASRGKLVADAKPVPRRKR